MGKIVSGVERERKRIENSVLAYMTVKNLTLNWIVGVVGSSKMNKGNLQKFFFICDQTYGTNPRFQELKENCRKLGYI